MWHQHLDAGVPQTTNAHSLSSHVNVPLSSPLLLSMVFTCAVDKTGAVWDCEVAQRVKKLKGHTSFVNSICPSRRGLSLLVSGSDDGNIKVSAVM